MSEIIAAVEVADEAAERDLRRIAWQTALILNGLGAKSATRKPFTIDDLLNPAPQRLPKKESRAAQIAEFNKTLARFGYGADDVFKQPPN